MKMLRNAGTERTLDLIKPLLKHDNSMDMATSSLSLFAFAELLVELPALKKSRLLLPGEEYDLPLLGTDRDRASRNNLKTRWLALRLAQWIQNKVELRHVSGTVPQGAAVLRDASGQPSTGHHGLILV